MFVNWFASSLFFMALQVLVAGGDPAADMPLRFILFEDMPYPPVKLRIHLAQPVGNVLMYRGLGYMKLPRGGADRRVVFNNVFAQFDCPFLNCSLHADHSSFHRGRNPFLTEENAPFRVPHEILRFIPMRLG